MDWSQIALWIDNLTNNPTFIAVVGVLTTTGAVFSFLKTTSVGKKALNSLTALGRNTNQIATDALVKVTAVEKFANDKIVELEAVFNEKVQELTIKYETKVAALISIVNFYEESLFAIVDLIPNKKVQERLLNFKYIYQDKKNEITNIVGVIYQDFDSVVATEKENIEAQYESKINYLENELARINLFLTELKEGDTNGKETENTNSIEAKI
jgi:hypothetical protein